MGRIQVNELLDAMSNREPMEEKIAFMEKVIKDEPYIKRLLEMAVKPELKITRIPEGYPKNYRPESDLPMGISDTNIRTEFRRIQNYIQGGALRVISDQKLLESWVALLQGLHFKEAEIMTWVKDQNLLDKYPDLWVVCPALGIETCINTEDDEDLPVLHKEELDDLVMGVLAEDVAAQINDAVLSGSPSVTTVTEPPKASPAKTTKKGKKE